MAIGTGLVLLVAAFAAPAVLKLMNDRAERHGPNPSIYASPEEAPGRSSNCDIPERHSDDRPALLAR